MLCEAEVHLSQGKSVAQLSQELGITEQIYYRWRKEYGGMKRIFHCGGDDFRWESTKFSLIYIRNHAKSTLIQDIMEQRPAAVI
jgi:membrane glycosyltransferase